MQKLSFILLILFILPGCSRINNLLNKHFFESCRPCPYFARAQRYLRTIRLYDQLSTVGIFTALWINQDVLEAYQFAYNQQRNQPLDTPLGCGLIKLNNNQLKFYVIGYQPALQGSVFNTCDSCDSKWYITLTVDDQIYHPASVLPFKADRILEAMLKPYHNRFNRLYEVNFDLKLNLEAGDHIVKLTFSCLEATGSLVWLVRDGVVVRAECDAYRVCRDCCMGY